ncbi:MAG: DMT family transporter, partial [Pseudomonadales bacterium]|nr:DMT family transporter [Pseudomonadales bacterium]
TMSLDTAIGDLMFVGCGLLWASYTLLCKHWKIDAWMATALVSVLSMFIYTPIYLLHSPGALGQIPLDTLLQQGLFQGVMVAILALYCYSRAVAILGSSRGAVFAALVPPTTMFLAVVLLSEVITVVEQFGLLAVSFGIVLALGLVKKVPFVNVA